MKIFTSSIPGILIVFSLVVVQACSSTIDNNKAVIDKGVKAREVSNGVTIKSYSITGSKETKDALTLYITVVQQDGPPLLDTMTFSKTVKGVLDVRE
ncbi:MAG: hypothetical protein QM802_03020 [Agriterribacter sp.]